ncbi:amino acid permease C-terminal domain-containing protein [Streptomyces sp. NPDC000880]
MTPILGLLFCLCMMFSLPGATWAVFGGWMIAGIMFYFGYGMRRSRLATAEK